jgi:hypothetical protein
MNYLRGDVKLVSAKAFAKGSKPIGLKVAATRFINFCNLWSLSKWRPTFYLPLNPSLKATLTK